MPGSDLKVCGGGGGGVRTKFSVQLWSQAEQLSDKDKVSRTRSIILRSQPNCFELILLMFPLFQSF